MQIMTKLSGAVLLALVTLMVLGASPVRADDAPVEMATVAVKSIDALTAIATEAGVPLPPFLTAGGIETQFAFIGKDGLAPDKPIGVIFFGAKGKSPQQLVTFVFPVKKGAASLESLKAIGGQPMAGHDDTVVLNGDVGLRRTSDYLVFSPSSAAAVAVDAEAFSKLTNDPDALAKLSVNVAAMREGMPDEMAGFIGVLEKQAETDIAAHSGQMGYAEGQHLFLDWLKDSIKNLNRAEIGLDAGDKTLRLWASEAPAKLPVIQASERPGLPAGIAARMDVAVSFAKVYPAAIPVLESWFSKGLSDQGAKGKPLTEDQIKQMRLIGTRLIALVANPAGTAVGVELAAGKPVFHIVQHWSEKFDGPGEIRDLADAIIKSSEPEDTSHLKVQTYDEAGENVLRIAAIEKEKTIGCMDVIQRGQNVYYSIATDEDHHIQSLLASPSEGPQKEIISAEIDLGKTIDAIIAFPNSNIPQIPEDKRKELSELLHGSKAKFSLSSHGEVTTIELTADRALLKIAQKMAAQ